MKTNSGQAVFDSRLHKKSVVAVYETETIRSLLKDILHPGGLELTKKVGETAGLDAECTILDIACGKGESILSLSADYGCRAVGIDLSPSKVADAATRSKVRSLRKNVYFLVSDAERLPFSDEVFDVVLSECSFSVLPSKERAASEIARVLKKGGRLVMTDIVHSDTAEARSDATELGLTLPCAAGARSTADYIEVFQACGLCGAYVEDQPKALKKIAYEIGIIFGGWKEFLETMSSELLDSSPKDEPKNIFCAGSRAQGFGPHVLGYTLIRMTKQ